MFKFSTLLGLVALVPAFTLAVGEWGQCGGINYSKCCLRHTRFVANCFLIPSCSWLYHLRRWIGLQCDQRLLLPVPVSAHETCNRCRQLIELQSRWNSRTPNVLVILVWTLGNPDLDQYFCWSQPHPRRGQPLHWLRRKTRLLGSVTCFKRCSNRSISALTTLMKLPLPSPPLATHP